MAVKKVVYITGKDGSSLEKKNGTTKTKVYPLVCDKLTLTCNVPESEKGQIIKKFKQFDSKPRGIYRHSIWVPEVGTSLPPYASKKDIHYKAHPFTSPLLQCDPKNSGPRFLRLEFNPSKLSSIEQLEARLDMILPSKFGYQHIVDNGVITRMDLAVDIAREDIDCLIMYYPKIAYSEVRSKSGKTLYLGAELDSEQRFCVYDKLAQINAHNTKVKNSYYDYPKAEPVPTKRIVRVEARLTKNTCVTLQDSLEYQNPFKKLLVYNQPIHQPPTETWPLFLALAKYEGAQQTLLRLPKKTRGKFVKVLKMRPPKWWKPDRIWSHYPSLIKRITSPSD